MVERSIKEIATEVKKTLDLEELSINLRGKDRRVVEFFSNLEGIMFGDPLPATKPFEIKDEGKEKDFVEIFVEATKLLLERVSDLEAQVEDVKKEHQLAKIEKRTPEKNLTDIPELSGTDPKTAHDDLAQVVSHAYGLLVEYTRAGILTEKQLDESGLGMQMVDDIRRTLQEEENKKFEKWKSNLETTYPFLADLQEFSGRTIKDEDLETSLQALRLALTNSRTTLSAEDKGKQGEHLKNNYWDPAEKKIEDLVTKLDVYKKEQARAKAVEDFTKEMNDLNRFIKIAPVAGIEIQNLKKDWFFSKFSELTTELKNERKLLQNEWTHLENLGILRDRTPTNPGHDEINSLLRDIRTRYNDALARLDKYIKDAEAPPVEHMSREEIADEVIKKNWDPFIWHEQKFQPDERMKEVVQAYKGFAFGKENDPVDEIDRIVQKTKVQLVTWDNKGIHEVGKASVHRGLLQEELMNRQFARHELMVATIYHPEWGEHVRQILEYLIKVSALRPGEKLVRRGGQLTHLLNGMAMEPGDVIETDGFGNLYEYEPGFDYDSLASDKGRDVLGEKIEERFSGTHKMAKFFANKLFTSMDMLSIPLMEMQLKTKTRSHNGGIGGKDYIALWKPEAALDHRFERYGGVTADWMGWWLYYLPDIGHDSTMGRPVAPGEDKAFDAEYLHEKQRLVKLHQRAYFDGSESEGKIEQVGFCESYFPHTYEALLLHEGEYLEVGDRVIDWQGNDAPVGQKQKMVGYDLYFIAESGWEKMLEMTFKSLGSDLTYEHVMEELKEGGKGGILSEFMGDGAGKAKMFKGEHLRRGLKPLLLHLIRRIFASYKGRGEQAEVRLFNGVIKSLEDSRSGGLAEYAVQIDEIIAELKKPPLLYGVMSESLKKRDSGHREEETREYMEAWYEEEFHEPPPDDVLGYGVVLDGNSQKENYLAVLRNAPGSRIPIPLTRQGDLIQKNEGH